MRIVQISDCHIVEPGALVADRVDSAAGLAAALDATRRFEPDLIVATGDLVNDARAAQYDHLEQLLAAAPAPVIPLPGNHDDRTELRRRFPTVLPRGGADEPIDHVLDTGGLRLVFVDTHDPGRNGGAFRPSQAAWLEARLGEAPDRPTIVFQHHPPFATGITFMDQEAFDGAGLEAEVIRRHPQVEQVACGHVHRVVQHRFAGTIATVWPSTAVALALDLGSELPTYCGEAPGFAVHDWVPGLGLRSHWQPTGPTDRWTPAWAMASAD